MRTPRRRRTGLLSEPGRGFCQYLPLFSQHPYLAAQPIEFVALGRGQAVAAQSFIESSLLEPLADRLNCRLEFTRQRGDAAAATRQFNDSTPVFRCVWWMGSGHLENSFSLSPTPSTKLGQLHLRQVPQSHLQQRPRPRPRPYGLYAELALRRPKAGRRQATGWGRTMDYKDVSAIGG